MAEEYDRYQPADTLDWPALRDLIAAARQETIALGRRIEAQRIDDTVTASHNALGQLSAREWSRYLATHAYTESFRLR